MATRTTCTLFEAITVMGVILASLHFSRHTFSASLPLNFVLVLAGMSNEITGF